jgi:hypothetical protein
MQPTRLHVEPKLLPREVISLIGVPPTLVGKLTAFENFVAELLAQSTHPILTGQFARPVTNPEQDLPQDQTEEGTGREDRQHDQPSPHEIPDRHQTPQASPNFFRTAASRPEPAICRATQSPADPPLERAL